MEDGRSAIGIQRIQQQMNADGRDEMDNWTKRKWTFEVPHAPTRKKGRGTRGALRPLTSDLFGLGSAAASAAAVGALAERNC